MPSEEGFTHRERIKREFEYKRVVTNGRLITGTMFNAYFLIHRDLERKAGFVAGKRVGNACLRNRAKRLLREAYRGLKPGLPACGFMAVFVAKASTPGAHLVEVRNEMAWMFKTCGLIETT